MKAIETKALVKKYGGLTAVNGLNLSVEEGELFALLGVNGAGKSTTIKMLCGLTAPTGGTGLLLGHDVVKEKQAVKSLLAVSPQETAVAPNLTVWENLMLLAGLSGASQAQASAQADEMMNRFQLNEKSSAKAKTLSGGQQRRLSIAMALISQPKVLFLDEPTLGLDVLARRELWKIVESLHGKVTIILTTHYMEEAEALADRIGIMAGGKLAAVGTAAELVAKANAKNFEDAFVTLATGEVQQ